jgi:peptidoglycan biosynthesis protein MviN/MurJ (putative lipid II flippase)
VMVRVGTWTSSTVLQGAGRHRLVALSNMVAAAVNIVLSIVLIHTHGLPGVAIATLIPVTIRGLGVLVPTACSRVGMPIGRFAAAAIWPAVWPAAIVLGGLTMARHQVPAATGHALLGQALMMGAVAGLIYAVLFLGVAIGREDRGRYVGKLRSIAGWPALETA